MAALGLTAFNQLALGANIYTSARSLVWYPGEPIVITHVVSSSATHPEKYMGRMPARLEGEIQLAASSELTFLADLQTQTIRHASFINAAGTEVYVHVYAGRVTSYEIIGRQGGGSASLKVRIGFSFQCGDQRLYKASDDSVLLGA